MKPVWPLIASICLLFGCDSIDDVEVGEAGKSPNHTSKTSKPSAEDGKTKGEETKTEGGSESDANASAPVQPDISTGKPWPPPSEPEKPQAILPKITPELLRVVKNWNRIPSSAFPREVTLSQPVTFFNRDKTTGKVMGRSYIPTGRQVVAFGQVGSASLVVGPNETSKIRETIPMKQTDLKMVLAYAFEVTKRRRAELALTNPPRATRPKPRPPKTQVNRPKPNKPKPNKPTRPPENKPERNDPGPLFEDVPEGKDFGHGKWCVCPQCRNKRAKGR